MILPVLACAGLGRSELLRGSAREPRLRASDVLAGLGHRSDLGLERSLGRTCLLHAGQARGAGAPGVDDVHVGQPLDAAFRAFRVALLQAGADDVPYLAGGAGQGGYTDVISPPSARALAVGDVLMLDTGATLNGYFCDFDRNFALGQADDAAVSAHERLWHATEAGLRAARPGATAADLFHAMHRVLGGGHSDVGRYGHGLGMQLTEWPSIHPDDATLLQPGMVITLEPSLTISEGRIMVHEENILIAEEGPELLTPRAPAQLPVLQPH